MTEEKKQSLHPISKILCEVYNDLAAYGEVSFLLGNDQVEKIDSAVKTVNAAYFGFKRYPTQKDRAAAYFCYIIKDHVVVDGNKRLATLWLEIYCGVSELKIGHVKLDELAVSVEKSPTQLNETIEIVKEVLFGKLATD